MEQLQTEKWQIKNDNDAEWLIEKVSEDLAENTRYMMSIENKIKVLSDKLKKVKEERDGVIERRNSHLALYFESIDDSQKKSTKTQDKYRLPSGDIVKKYPAPKVEKDDVALLGWLKNSGMDDYIEVKELPKWGELKKATESVNDQVIFKETGEVIEGVNLIERAPTLEFKEA